MSLLILARGAKETPNRYEQKNPQHSLRVLGVKGKCQGGSELTVGAAVRPSEIQALP
jgi:hypothetical protein